MSSTGVRSRIIPATGGHPSVARDALEAFKVLEADGVVIVPTDVGYGIMSCSAEGIERAFKAKLRKPGHTLGIIGSYQTHLDLHKLPPEKFEMTRVITQDHGSLLAIVAPYYADHPRLQHLSEQTRERVTKGETLGVAIAEGPFLRELCRLIDVSGKLIVGSSANLSGQGQKFRVEDIEPDVRECADLIIDYGLQRYYRYGRAGTIIDMQNMQVIRMGAAYELFRERMKKWFDVSLPEDIEHSTRDVKVGVSVKLDS